MALIRPRLTDHFGILVSQAEVDFAIPFLDEDIPLYLDPFLLWRSPSLQDQSLHTGLINAFNYLGVLVRQGREQQAVSTLVMASECQEVGFGESSTRKGTNPRWRRLRYGFIGMWKAHVIGLQKSALTLGTKRMKKLNLTMLKMTTKIKSN
jgi:hypothetical protein